MEIRFYTSVIALLVIFFSAMAYARSLISSDHMTVDSVNLTAQKFFRSYMSKDADERKNAELYLLGVMDTTEGKSWCDYRTFKTVTLRERIFEEFKKLDSSRFNERASGVVEDILSRRYPCGGRE
ncbi:Rap1a/Tai family immunity protein [Candidatus Thiosymbion oneisti]|uniref:Rap1a/Tai family immunity protein n=1 Tax=Candidatus Thiosymbion oneisti TaxID=589554 RepID=UPI000B7F33C1|nr:Rap1a/Tai family immunity protein [Candidatus Thiosymbion oneisti]